MVEARIQRTGGWTHQLKENTAARRKRVRWEGGGMPADQKATTESPKEKDFTGSVTRAGDENKKMRVKESTRQGHLSRGHSTP